MRIAFYAPLKSPGHATPSGDRRVARLLVQALELAGHEVRLAAELRSHEGQGDPARQQALRDEGLTIAMALVDAWRGPEAAGCPQLWFTYHLYYKAPDWIGPAVCAALGIPYVVAEASHAPKRAQGPWALNHAGVEQALRAADLLLCPTRDDLACVREVARAGVPVQQLPPFLDPVPYVSARARRSQHRAQLASNHALDTAVPWIVVSAMMRPGDKLTSYRELATALALLQDLNWRVLVAGDGQARDEVHALLQSAVPGRACYAGLLEAEAMAALYAASDLCLWPAVNEAYGMAMLEAQASGVPVVSCRLRGVPDVVQDGLTGLLVPGADAQALADATRQLLVDPALRTRMGDAAACFVAQERSVAQAAGRLRQLLPARRNVAPQAAPRREQA